MAKKDGTLTWMGSLFSITGIGMLIGSFLSYNSTHNFIKNSSSTIATVTELRLQTSSSSSSSSKSSTYYPIVKFKTQKGESVEFQSSVGTYPPSFRVGETVSVLYDANNPAEAEINSFWQLWFTAIFLLAMGGLFAGIGLSLIAGPLAFRFSSNKKAAKLQANGKKIVTKFTGVELNTFLTVNGSSPYQIISQWFDPETNQVYVFHSENIWFDPEEFIKYETIDVYVDPNNMKKYHMDISFLPKLAN
ncbi:DUF3592 domain-containing protein [Trichocoleus sp. FACHB-90]|uniref:DUF3592 domain-containing protein n=1 Tax=Cyanophyceae TaxID=3028117 RepID=UPI001686BE22|nr:DUF3592 domain-containing protein [Trichocoleus sp. FACHB-90]MBD1928846.1 DUF3592 domain-containing protein [Trichocoleus sp. FACHB-90]